MNSSRLAGGRLGSADSLYPRRAALTSNLIDVLAAGRAGSGSRPDESAAGAHPASGLRNWRVRI